MVRKHLSFFVIASVLFVSFFTMPVAAEVTNIVSTTPANQIKEACATNPNSPLCKDYDPENPNNPINELLSTVISIMSYIAGILAVIFVMFGGFKYITSGGDAQKAASGRQTLTYALIGLVVVIVSRQLILFVLDRFIK